MMSVERAPLWTAMDVAEYLGVPVGTLHNWRYKGTGPRAAKVAGKLRYRPSDVDKWLDERSGTSSMAVA